MLKFIKEVEKVIPRGYYTEQAGDRLYIYKDKAYKFMPNKTGQRYVYVFYKEEIDEAPNECLDLLKTIIDMRY